jgi:hypothetical protein
VDAEHVPIVASFALVHVILRIEREIMRHELTDRDATLDHREQAVLAIDEMTGDVEGDGIVGDDPLSGACICAAVLCHLEAWLTLRLRTCVPSQCSASSGVMRRTILLGVGGASVIPVTRCARKCAAHA